MQLDSNVPIPLSTPAKTRTRKPRATSVAAPVGPNPAQSLIDALKFVKPVQSKTGAAYQTHCIISGHWLCASNGILTMATPVHEDLNACPHSLDLLDALQKCGQDLNITQLSANQLAVRSGDFKAIIDCCSPSEINIPAPDNNIAKINNEVKDAIASVMVLANEDAPNAAYAGVLLQAGSTVATNGHALLEAWHGVDLPAGLLLPKPFCAAVGRSGKDATGFGYSPSSVTFHFDDGSFVKTQLYNERFPEYKHLFNRARELWPIPLKLMEAIRAVESFSKNGIIYFDNDVVSSRELQSEATTFKIVGLPVGLAFNAKLLIQMEHAIRNIAFNLENNETFFSADNIRGCLKGLDIKPKPLDQTPEVKAANRKQFADMDDDIPF